MNYFLQTYYGLDEEIAKIMSTHSHKSLSVIARLYGINFKRMSFDSITKDLIYTGKVILVNDHYKNVAPYIKPFLTLEDEYQTDMEEMYTSHEVYDLKGEEENDKHKGRQKVKHVKP